MSGGCSQLNVSVLHQDEGGIGKSIPAAQFPETQEISRGRSPREISRVEGNPRDFPRPWVLHPETRGISRGRSPREIPRVEGCKTHGRGKSRGRRGWISRYLPSLGGARTFSHHYQGRIDFNTVNPSHSTGMDLVSIPASRGVLANPIPRDKIFQYSPCRGLSTHPRAMNTQ